jgi:DNA modification methylase
MTRWHILAGDCLASLQLMPEQSVQCCITSPPYWGLRDYGHDGQIGLEATPDAYVAEMVAVFREVRRVLKDDGTLWLNLGDSYAATTRGSGGTGKSTLVGTPDDKNGRRFTPRRMDIGSLKPKDLVGIPWRVAFALQADGWWLRQDIIWHKPNPMPESVTDRCTKAHEYVFLLTKSGRYYYDAEAVCEPAINKSCGNIQPTKGARTGDVKHQTKGNLHMIGAAEHRNRRSVWSIATQPYSGAHFAVMPQALVEPCLLAGSRPGDLVLDPFTGSGTVGAVAIGHGRSFIGCELNPAYIDLARQRIGSVAPMFSAEAQPWGPA